MNAFEKAYKKIFFAWQTDMAYSKVRDLERQMAMCHRPIRTTCVDCDEPMPEGSTWCRECEGGAT